MPGKAPLARNGGAYLWTPPHYATLEKYLRSPAACRKGLSHWLVQHIWAPGGRGVFQKSPTWEKGIAKSFSAVGQRCMKAYIAWSPGSPSSARNASHLHFFLAGPADGHKSPPSDAVLCFPIIWSKTTEAVGRGARWRLCAFSIFVWQTA